MPSNISVHTRPCSIIGLFHLGFCILSFLFYFLFLRLFYFKSYVYSIHAFKATFEVERHNIVFCYICQHIVNVEKVFFDPG